MRGSLAARDASACHSIANWLHESLVSGSVADLADCSLARALRRYRSEIGIMVHSPSFWREHNALSTGNCLKCDDTQPTPPCGRSSTEHSRGINRQKPPEIRKQVCGSAMDTYFANINRKARNRWRRDRAFYCRRCVDDETKISCGMRCWSCAHTGYDDSDVRHASPVQCSDLRCSRSRHRQPRRLDHRQASPKRLPEQRHSYARRLKQ
jgi:hypothetical protein